MQNVESEHLPTMVALNAALHPPGGRTPADVGQQRWGKNIKEHVDAAALITKYQAEVRLRENETRIGAVKDVEAAEEKTRGLERELYNLRLTAANLIQAAEGNDRAIEALAGRDMFGDGFSLGQNLQTCIADTKSALPEYKDIVRGKSRVQKTIDQQERKRLEKVNKEKARKAGQLRPMDIVEAEREEPASPRVNLQHPDEHPVAAAARRAQRTVDQAEAGRMTLKALKGEVHTVAVAKG